MSTTPTLEALQGEFTLRIDDVLRMCADIQANLGFFARRLEKVYSNNQV